MKSLYVLTWRALFVFCMQYISPINECVKSENDRQDVT